ncbi:MAG: DUF423 domain-containing protein [Proteobacteria bacterium]|nr:DUF423 domain-containing protein [Pseudomonadota bacterium]
MALAVGLGAFGAHALSAMVDAKALANWHTAVMYHLVHGLALLVFAVWIQLGAPNYVRYVFIGVMLGILLFSGSLYAYVLTDWKLWVFFTPIGGIVWLVSWLGLAWLTYRS